MRSARSFTQLAKKEVQDILLQNHELIKDLEKTELLLKNQTKLVGTLSAELEAAKKGATDEVSRLQRREAQRTTELADSKRQLMQLQEVGAHSDHLTLPHRFLSLSPLLCPLFLARAVRPPSLPL